jgi:hypothetical protein
MCRAIADAIALDEVKDIRSTAAQLEAAARVAKNTEAEQKVREIRIRAERRMGELLAELPKTTPQERAERANATQGRRSPEAAENVSSPYAQALADNDITTQEASRYKKVAKMPTAEFEASLVPKPKKASAPRRPKPEPVRRTDEDATKLSAALVLDTGATLKEAAETAGLASEQTVKTAVAEEVGARKTLASLEIDPGTLSLTAKQKLAALELRLTKGAERTLAQWRAGFDAEVREKVEARVAERLAMLKASQAEAIAERDNYRKLTNDWKPIYTVDEWKLLAKVAHPDRQNAVTEQERNEAVALLNVKRAALTKEKAR